MPIKDSEKRKEYNRQYRIKNKAALDENVRRWRSNPNNRDKERHAARDYNRYRKDRDKFLAHRRFRIYGITKEEYDTMVVTQNNQCAICRKQMKLPHVDHNHGTGKNRELLCQHCNMMLGMCFENSDILLSAIQYLEKHSEYNQSCNSHDI